MRFNHLAIAIIVGLVYMFGALGQVNAGYFYFEPLTKTVKPDTEFDILLKAQTDGDGIITTDARIDFDPGSFSFVKLIELSSTESFFPQMFHRLIGDSIYIASYIAVSYTHLDAFRAISAPVKEREAIHEFSFEIEGPRHA